MSMAQDDAAIFKTAAGALRWAMNYRHGALKAGGMAALYGKARPAGRGLGGLDGAAQAGMIMAEVGGLEPNIRGHIIIARYTNRGMPCTCGSACCSGQRVNAEWQAAVSEIVDIVRLAALRGCSVNIQLRHALVRRYFGVHTGLAEAAKASGVDRNTASAHASKVITYLKQEERLAMYEIEGMLKAAGMID